MKLRPIKRKKGQVGGLSSNILALGVAALILVLMLVIVQELRDTQITGAANCNATTTTACDQAFQQGNATLAGLATFSDFWTIIVLAIVAAVVLGIIFGAFGGLTRTR